jgi:hypothetical protein
MPNPLRERAKILNCRERGEDRSARIHGAVKQPARSESGSTEDSARLQLRSLKIGRSNIGAESGSDLPIWCDFRATVRDLLITIGGTVFEIGRFVLNAPLSSVICQLQSRFGLGTIQGR